MSRRRRRRMSESKLPSDEPTIHATALRRAERAAARNRQRIEGTVSRSPSRNMVIKEQEGDLGLAGHSRRANAAQEFDSLEFSTDPCGGYARVGSQASKQGTSDPSGSET